jgi:hypothetical protein
MEQLGMEPLVLEPHATQVLHSTILAAAVKLQFSFVHQDHFGMDIDVLSSQTYVQLE